MVAATVCCQRWDPSGRTLTEVFRQGARRLLMEAVGVRGSRVPGGLLPGAGGPSALSVCNAYLPQRQVQTGIGGVAGPSGPCRPDGSVSEECGRQGCLWQELELLGIAGG